MGGVFVSKAAPTFAKLAREIETTLRDCKEQGLFLDGDMTIKTRENLEGDIKKFQRKYKRKSRNPLEELLADRSNEWFVFFHVHS